MPSFSFLDVLLNVLLADLILLGIAVGMFIVAVAAFVFGALVDMVRSSGWWKLCRSWIGFSVVIAFAASSAIGASPASELRATVADCEHLAAVVQPGVRYLTLYNIPAGERAKTLRVAQYVLNAVSRNRTMARLHEVSPTLYRFSIASVASERADYYAWQAAWEKIAEEDDYFHLRTEIDEHGHRKEVTTDGGWVGLDQAARLRKLTYSIGGLLRADQFLAAAAQTPHYYALAGIPATEGEFIKALGIDQQTIEKLRANAGANLIISGVTEKPRRVIWMQGPRGGVYATLDVARVDATRDPIRRALTEGKLRFVYDASEWFAVGPNGLWWVAIFDAQGKRQDTVPDKVAKDTSDPRGDGIVIPLISCIRCHKEGGLRPFEDEQIKLIQRGFGPHSDDQRLVQRALEFYDEPRLKRQMEFDRGTYALAVHRATGLDKPEQLALELRDVFRAIQYEPVTLESAAREVGVTPAAFVAANRSTSDPHIDALCHGGARLRGIWESSFQAAAIAVESQR